MPTRTMMLMGTVAFGSVATEQTVVFHRRFDIMPTVVATARGTSANVNVYVTDVNQASVKLKLSAPPGTSIKVDWHAIQAPGM